MAQALGGCRQRAFGRERADVQLVDHRVVDLDATPAGAGRRHDVDDLARPVHAFGLAARSRVGPGGAVDLDAVACAGRQRLGGRAPVAQRVAVQHQRRAAVVEDDAQRQLLRREDTEGRTAVGQPVVAQAAERREHRSRPQSRS
ncbi:hypothetical protein [Rubrivivax gelatinosus]|uniref:hypothetical protein n=1 Tax=Rubrivivax gelatinosus TaxID=28068 RepID=UPI0005C1CDA4|nr:hypothetical protein [Rubrivivax gelatinosus]